MKKLLTVAIIFFLLGIQAHALEIEDGSGLINLATYVVTTDKQIRVAWQPISNCDYYDVVAYHFERATEAPAGSGRTEETFISFQLPVSGHFVVKVRACRAGADPVCSAWSKSEDPAVATVNGEPCGWWLYGHVAPAGPIIIREGN